MCYSSQVWADYKKYVRMFNAKLSIKEFSEIFWEQKPGGWAKVVPKGMRDSFDNPASDEEASVKARFDAVRADLVAKEQEEIDKQSARLALNEAKLAAKPQLKGAAQEIRVAKDKIAKARRRLEDVERHDEKPRDRRIFPGWYAPVMIWENGERVVRHMRFQCRPTWAGPDWEEKFPATFNARLDKMESTWRDQFTYTHGPSPVDWYQR